MHVGVHDPRSPDEAGQPGRLQRKLARQILLAGLGNPIRPHAGHVAFRDARTHKDEAPGPIREHRWDKRSHQVQSPIETGAEDCGRLTSHGFPNHRTGRTRSESENVARFAWRFFSLRAFNTNRAPRSHNPSAIAAPTPPDAPVTTQVSSPSPIQNIIGKIRSGFKLTHITIAFYVPGSMSAGNRIGHHKHVGKTTGCPFCRLLRRSQAKGLIVELNRAVSSIGDFR